MISQTDIISSNKKQKTWNFNKQEIIDILSININIIILLILILSQHIFRNVRLERNFKTEIVDSLTPLSIDVSEVCTSRAFSSSI